MEIERPVNDLRNPFKAQKRKRDVREFTRQDWMSFQGAESWSAATRPLIAENQKTMILADKTSVLVMIEGDPQNEYGGWTLDIAFPTQAMAKIFLNGFPEDFDSLYLQANGFKAA